MFREKKIEHTKRKLIFAADQLRGRAKWFERKLIGSLSVGLSVCRFLVAAVVSLASALLMGPFVVANGPACERAATGRDNCDSKLKNK